MKQEPMFEESRGEMFKRIFEQEFDEIRGALRLRTPSRMGIWSGSATRKRARALARLKARHNMRLYRSVHAEEK